tara:strand:- start:1074 stop:1613 length:540 start_codon:yes stop_codon:yes gene_type:complete
MIRLIITIVISLNFLITGFSVLGKGMCSFSGVAGGRASLITTNLSSTEGVISCNVVGFGIIGLVIGFWIYAFKDKTLPVFNEEIKPINIQKQYEKIEDNTKEKINNISKELNIDNYQDTKAEEALINANKELLNLKIQIEKLKDERELKEKELKSLLDQESKKDELIDEIQKLRRDLYE